MMISRYLTFTCFLILMLVSCYKPEFDGDNPEITTLIEAIQEYERTNDQPPENLEDLVPAYLPKLHKPTSVTQIVYNVNDLDKSWSLEFTMRSGGSCTYDGEFSLWSCKPSPP